MYVWVALEILVVGHKLPFYSTFRDPKFQMNFEASRIDIQNWKCLTFSDKRIDCG